MINSNDALHSSQKLVYHTSIARLELVMDKDRNIVAENGYDATGELVYSRKSSFFVKDLPISSDLRFLDAKAGSWVEFKENRSYNNRHQLIEVVRSHGKSSYLIRHSLHGNGTLARDVEDLIEHYSPDGLLLKDSITHDISQSTCTSMYEYDQAGRVVGITETNPDGSAFTKKFSYDSDGKLLAWERFDDKGVLIGKHENRFDDCGRITRETDWASDVVRVYEKLPDGTRNLIFYNFTPEMRLLGTDRYDQKGRLIQKQDNRFDESGRVVGETVWQLKDGATDTSLDIRPAGVTLCETTTLHFYDLNDGRDGKQGNANLVWHNNTGVIVESLIHEIAHVFAPADQSRIIADATFDDYIPIAAVRSYRFDHAAGLETTDLIAADGEILQKSVLKMDDAGRILSREEYRNPRLLFL